MSTCEICGEPMPDGENMFKFHGYSGPCPKPPLKNLAVREPLFDRLLQLDIEGEGMASETMSLRDHFAGLAMQSLIVADHIPHVFETLAQTAYDIADTMILERQAGNAKRIKAEAKGEKSKPAAHSEHGK